MKHRIMLFASILSSMLFLPETASAQPTCTLPLTQAWLRVSDNGGANDTLWFGFDSTATCGEDPQFCEIYLVEPCGAPNPLFCIFWGNPCGFPGEPSSLRRNDIRQSINRNDIDTHRVAFMSGVGGFPIRLKWDRIVVSSICDSAILQDEFGGLFIKTRMDLVDSLTITNPVFSRLFLIRYGQRQLSTDVRQFDPVPGEFNLYQNYPNPFNPTTEIGFRIVDFGFVSLRVFDVLGREVATLVNETLPAGTHKHTFDATGLASGVYLYRLSSGGRTEVRKMILTK